jgi:hypothetical protein
MALKKPRKKARNPRQGADDDALDRRIRAVGARFKAECAQARQDFISGSTRWKSLHAHLLAIVFRRSSDFESLGERSRAKDWAPDCSCGCRFFIPRAGNLGKDWGVCINTRSPRCALLTFEHQGCGAFEEEAETE